MSAADNAGACGVLQTGSGEDSGAEPDAREDVEECSGDELDDVLVSVDELEGCVVDTGSSGCDHVSMGEVLCDTGRTEEFKDISWRATQ